MVLKDDPGRRSNRYSYAVIFGVELYIRVEDSDSSILWRELFGVCCLSPASRKKILGISRVDFFGVELFSRVGEESLFFVCCSCS
jgi:hypothetical protein